MQQENRSASHLPNTGFAAASTEALAFRVAWIPEGRKERRCLSRNGSATRKAKGSVVAVKAVETHRAKYSILPAFAIEIVCCSIACNNPPPQHDA